MAEAAKEQKRWCEWQKLVEEIIVEILLRLPVESLLRCRSVCKVWYSLISDPHFVESHLTLSSASNSRHRLIFSTLSKINLKTCALYDALHHHSPLNALDLHYPMKHPRKSVWIVGSCNGLLCIAIEEDTLFIWNPTTRNSTRLPYCGRKPQQPGCYVLYGFGSPPPPHHHDYRVVEISCVFKHRAKYSTAVRIYSLKSGNWKKIDAFPHGIPLDDSGKFSNGALHWAASKDFGSSYSWTIVSLHLANETYAEILQPVYDEGDKDLTLGVLGECLCVLCNYRGLRADVWVMKLYGVKESWTKLLSIPYLTDPGRDQFSVPFCVSNDGKLLLQFGSKLIVYDSNSSSSSEIQNVDECLEACTFVESLVSPDAPNRPWR